MTKADFHLIPFDTIRRLMGFWAMGIMKLECRVEFLMCGYVRWIDGDDNGKRRNGQMEG